MFFELKLQLLFVLAMGPPDHLLRLFKLYFAKSYHNLGSLDLFFNELDYLGVHLIIRCV